MRSFLNRLDWLQRHNVSIALAKCDWRGAVAAVPEEMRAELRKLCDKNSLADLAALFDPAREGIHVALHDEADYFG